MRAITSRNEIRSGEIIDIVAFPLIIGKFMRGKVHKRGETCFMLFASAFSCRKKSSLLELPAHKKDYEDVYMHFVSQ